MVLFLPTLRLRRLHVTQLSLKFKGFGYTTLCSGPEEGETQPQLGGSRAHLWSDDQMEQMKMVNLLVFLFVY